MLISIDQSIIQLYTGEPYWSKSLKGRDCPKKRNVSLLQCAHFSSTIFAFGVEGGFHFPNSKARCPPIFLIGIEISRRAKYWAMPS